MMRSESIDVYKFLEWFSPTSLHYSSPGFHLNDPWVFWRQNEGSEINNHSSSATGELRFPFLIVKTRDELMKEICINYFLIYNQLTTLNCTADLEIHDKIKSVFSNVKSYWAPLFGQFWAPVTTIGGRQLLSTSGQPFAVWDDLSNEMAKYRLYTEKHKYNIDIMNYYNNKPADNEEGDHMIISGGPATAFLSRLPYFTQLQWIQAESFPSDGRLNYSIMLPICFPSQSSSSCIGVLEFTFDHETYKLGDLVLQTIRAIKREAGLDVIPVQDLIPYKNINGLELAKEEIKEALKVVCESHNLALAQVWVAYEESRMPSPSSLEDTQIKRLSAVKLDGYLNVLEKNKIVGFYAYLRLCDVIPRGITEEFALETLQDYASRYFSNFHSYMMVSCNPNFHRSSAFTICLRSNDTGNFNYVFEFILREYSNYVGLLEDLLLTLNRCLPKFKFASGVELGDKLDITLVESDMYNEANETGETKKFMIFQGKRSIPMPKAHEEGKKPMIVDPKAPSEVTCKTTPKVLSREAIENQFGKTMKEAAKNLKVSLSTLKRKFKELGIPEWPGPGFLKRKAEDSSIFRIDTNEEDNGAIQEPSTINVDQNTLTIKAKIKDDMIKFHLPISQATFATIKQEIGMKLKLSAGTYKLHYLDEDGDWILLTSDEEMRDCIKSSRKAYRTVVKIRVLPSPQPII